MEEMRRNGGVLGGEQSGHIIFLDHATTGDGLVTALELLRVIRETGQPLSCLSAQMRRFPQIMVNVRVDNKEELKTNQKIAAAISCAEEQLKGTGEDFGAPIRNRTTGKGLWGEALDEQKLKEVVNELAEVVAENLGCELVKS